MSDDWPDRLYCYRISDKYDQFGKWVTSTHKKPVDEVEWAIECKEYVPIEELQSLNDGEQ